MRKLFIILTSILAFTFLLGNLSLAQTDDPSTTNGYDLKGGIIEGFILTRDPNNVLNSPVPFATVSIKIKKFFDTQKKGISFTQQIKSDKNGYYRFEYLPAANYLVSAKKKGFKDESKNISVLNGQTVRLNLILLSNALPIPGSLSGLVYTITNAGTTEPISGATITISPYFPYPTFAPLPVYSTTTDDRGSYKFLSLPADNYTFQVDAKGYVSQNGMVKIAMGKETVYHVVLTRIIPVITLQGHVYDGSVRCDNGERCIVPIGGAEIALFPNSYELIDPPINIPPIEILFYTTTNEKGYYEFINLPPGEYSYTMTVAAKGYEPWTGIIKVVPGENIYDVSLMPVIPCTDNSQCMRDDYCAKQAGDCYGEGTCEQKPEACPEIYAPVCGCDGRTYGNECEASSFGVNVDYAGTCKPVIKYGSISGYVFNGAVDCTMTDCIMPVINAEITLFELTIISSKPPKKFRTTTDKKGFYSITKIPAGKYYMTVSAKNYQTLEQKVRIIAGIDTTNNISLMPVIPAGSVLKGHVYDGSVKCADGEKCIVPISGASVVIYFMTFINDETIPSYQEYKTVTNKEGYYEFRNLPQGQYTVTVSARYYQYWKEIIKIGAGENTLDVRLLQQKKAK